MDLLGALASRRLLFFRSADVGDAFEEWLALHQHWVRPDGVIVDEGRLEDLERLESLLVDQVLESDPERWLRTRRRWPCDTFPAGCDPLYFMASDPFAVFSVAAVQTIAGVRAKVVLFHFGAAAEVPPDLWLAIIRPRYQAQFGAVPHAM
jgi:hypothetical protein